MRHGNKGRRLGVTTPHRRSMMANLAVSLIQHGGINTTEARAKELRPFVEELVTLAKRGDLHARRLVTARLRDPGATKKLFDEWAPKFVSHPTKAGDGWNGGYVRILRLGLRKGDSASISLVQFVTAESGESSASRKPAQEKKSEPAKSSSEKDNAASEETS
ncbi:MAG TPA: 50S ribosomal protein L17 [Candidatus Latescibacteria bacterium]|nr:50S ribosomal protein L17 [Candidatus Latescibacterota bacterium]HOM56494.1 50S ribosomal protein L17 [Candidatus Latescibacterota bacterium]HOS64717.1 50S ribosomal protein L17 [Candidatus Latescibacterota bacterium]HPC44321.1 50S ribosomal protein L17 [Candidatus Latescibacterota bacterium]HPK73616.1 50S ribosomal protein L17 [Candidatus Latescibacterota bacterium]